MAEGERTYLDVSGLPRHEPGPSQLTWWGNLAFMVTEGVSLAVCVVTFIYLRRNFQSWAPVRTANPDLIIPTISMIALLVTAYLGWLEGRAARVLDVPGIKFWGALNFFGGVVVIVLRALEFNSLNTRWDSDAYGSIVWFTVGLHATLLVLMVLEDFFYLLIAFIKPVTRDHATHVVEKSNYAIFVAASWVFLYILIYWGPRFL